MARLTLKGLIILGIWLGFWANSFAQFRPPLLKNPSQPQQPVLGQPPVTQQPGTQQPGTQQPGTQKPGTKKPGTQQPGTQQPGTQQPGTQQPGTQQPGTQPSQPSSIGGYKIVTLPQFIGSSQGSFNTQGGLGGMGAGNFFGMNPYNMGSMGGGFGGFGGFSGLGGYSGYPGMGGMMGYGSGFGGMNPFMMQNPFQQQLLGGGMGGMGMGGMGMGGMGWGGFNPAMPFNNNFNSPFFQGNALPFGQNNLMAQGAMGFGFGNFGNAPIVGANIGGWNGIGFNPAMGGFGAFGGGFNPALGFRP